MPMPGSQQMDTLELAYFLNSWRWVIRIVLLIVVVFGARAVFRTQRKWPAIAVLVFTGTVVWLCNMEMKADRMFLQPKQLIFKDISENKVPADRLVIGVVHNGEAKAYPIQFLAYHHQVFDKIGGIPVIVTYCNVCRSARVFEPKVNGHLEHFRLVGMDHFNAMFEDATTGSWWRQENGEAVAGSLKGEMLPEMVSLQMTVAKWFELYPEGKLMQPDPESRDKYDRQARFEKGKSKSKLTMTDSEAWKEKSWVVGITVNGISKAYSWNQLKREGTINDRVGNQDIVVVLSEDNNSFAVFARPDRREIKLTKNDQLLVNDEVYDFSGKSISSGKKLLQYQSYQEFWHSWRTFHPSTLKYEP